MEAVGIVCEYNPYHPGHAWQLCRAREACGCPVVLAVMSEYITQRGELALADPYLRAEAAVRGGADLVVGLPYPWSGASGDFFAAAGVEIAARLGASCLHFGSECGDITQLASAAEVLGSADFAAALRSWQTENPNRGVMEGRELCFRKKTDRTLPGGSNDLLGIAYLTAIQAHFPALRAYTARRQGQAYTDSAAPEDAFPSALSLRTLLKKGERDAFLAHLPADTRRLWQNAEARFPVREEAVEAALLAFYRTADTARLSALAGLGGGLAGRLQDAARKSTGLAGLLALAATRRYTAARLRRGLWFGYFGVTDADLRTPVSYVRLLAASRRGCEYLRERRGELHLPLLTKPADFPRTPAASRQRSLEDAVEALYTLALPTPRDAGFFLRKQPYIAPYSPPRDPNPTTL